MAPEIADQREVALVPVPVRRDGAVARPPQHRPGFVGQGEVVVDAGDDLHAPPVAVRKPLPVDGLHAPDVGSAIPSDWNSIVDGQPARHARAPEQLVAELPVDHLVQLGELSRQSSMLACTPVMSSSCDSLKSVVIRGCVNAEPSPAGCVVSASSPFARTRRPSFSMPRSKPLSTEGGRAFTRSRIPVKCTSLVRPSPCAARAGPVQAAIGRMKDSGEWA